MNKMHDKEDQGDKQHHSMPNLSSQRTVNGTESIRQRRRFSSFSEATLKQRHPEFGDFHHKPSPFKIRWIHGYNPKAGVINLNNRGSTTVFYAANNCGVLYNWTTNQMKILQGHRHMITCIATDSQGQWLVTADTGPENILTVWNSTDFVPQKTLFSPHGHVKLAKVALSADAKYLLTLGYGDKARLNWWIWSFGYEQPHATIEANMPRDSVIVMSFNPHNSEQFVLMTKSDIWIGVSGKIFLSERGFLKETNDYQLKIRKVERPATPDVGKLTCFTFVEDSSQILAGTSKGLALVYGYTIEYTTNADSSKYENLRFVKVLKVDNRRINVIKNVDRIIVIGNSRGEIHFFDSQLKLLYWIHGFRVDCVKGLSFNISPRSYEIFDPQCNKLCPCWERVEMLVDPVTGTKRQKLLKKKLPTDATTKSKPILVRDFIICTQNQGIGFVDFVTEKLETILNYRVSPALSLTVHPERQLLCVGYTDGQIEMIDIVQHKIFTRLDLRDRYKIVTPPKDDSIHGNYDITLPHLSVTCLKYSPSGFHLACGLNTGELLFLDPVTLDIITRKPFKDTNHSIKQFAYSEDSLTLAFSDMGKTVGVYKYDCLHRIWNFIGKHRAHYKDISSIFFTPIKNPNGEYKLFSLGMDRMMVEYDIGESSDEYLTVFSLDRIEQSAIPLGGIVWPTPKNLDPEEFRSDLPTILVANNEYKYKIINCNIAMTLSTILGPRYENPVCKLQLIRKGGDDNQQYLLFASKNIIGLQKMPIDGNPWKHIGLLGHPVHIYEICFREDTGTLFTIGAKDSSVCQWAANYDAVDTTTQLGGSALDPYYCLLEDGRPGWLFQEIRDLFYYIQILCQGTFSPAIRRVKDYIAIDSLPDLMRALGYFPSEYEVENLLIEAKYKVYQKKQSAEVDFEEFVKLYLNHRPAFNEHFGKIRTAFKTFASIAKETYFMHRDEFIEILNQYGELFSRELSWYLLSILSGQSFEDRAALTDDDFSFLPEPLTFPDLVNNILGIPDSDNISEQCTLSSMGSQGSSSVTSASDEK